jgi:hypothetical protein
MHPEAGAHQLMWITSSSAPKACSEPQESPATVDRSVDAPKLAVLIDLK